MQMSSILCLFEETKNCQVLNMCVLETKNVEYFLCILTNQECSSTFYLFEGTQNIIYFMCVFKNPRLLSYFHVYFEKTENVQYFMHIQETTNVEYFMGMPITFCTFKKTQNVDFVTLVFKKPWTLSVLCKCKVSCIFEKPKFQVLECIFEKIKNVQYFIHTQETTYFKYFLRMSSTFMHIWGSMNVEYLMHIWETTNVKYFPQMFRTLYAILPSLITGPCSSIHSICLCPST